MHLVEDYEDSSCSHSVADNESLPEEQSPAADQQPRKDKKRNAEQEMCISFFDDFDGAFLQIRE